MTRDQARAILANLELIQHFADGGDIGHTGTTVHGKQMAIWPTNKIVLSNLSVNERHYVAVKPKLAWDRHAGAYVRHQRRWPETIRASEVIK